MGPRMVLGCALVGILGVVLFGLTSCDKTRKATPGDLLGEGPESAVTESEETEGTSPQPATPGVVAPVFLHGEGRAVMGGKDTPETAFLNEDQAREAIFEVLGEAGITAGLVDKVLDPLNLPIVTPSDLLELLPAGALPASLSEEALSAELGALRDRLHERLLTAASSQPPFHPDASRLDPIIDQLLKPGVPSSAEGVPWRVGVAERSYPGGSWPSISIRLALDGGNSSEALYFEFVSSTDWNEWNPEILAPYEETWNMALYDTALSLRTGLVARGPSSDYVVFYDPCVPIARRRDVTKTNGEGSDLDDETLRSAAYAEALELLRAQVRDFVAWYQGRSTPEAGT